MAKVAARGTRSWLDEIALAGELTAIDLTPAEQEVIDVSTFSSTGKPKVIGNYDSMASLMGLFDYADDGFDEQAFVNFLTDEDHYLATAFGAAAENDVVYEQPIRLKSQPRSAKQGAAFLLNIEAEGAGPIVRGRILRSAAIVGTGNGTGRNLGASSSGQLRVVTYRVLAVSGSGSITLQYHESQDDGGSDAYASVAALASGALTAVGVTRKTTTAATEAWGRITVSAFSGFTSVTVLVTAGTAPTV